MTFEENVLESPSVGSGPLKATYALRSVLEYAAPFVYNAITAGIANIPTQTHEDLEPPTTGVKIFTGSSGIDIGSSALLKVDYGDFQHPMATRRAPGHMVYGRDLSDVVQRVNAAKRALSDAMHSLDYNQWRRLQKSYPTLLRMNRLQAYREWHWIDEPIDLLSWTWAGHTTNTEHLRVGALIERLSARLSETSHPAIAADIERLRGLPVNEIMMISRPIAPTPMANIRFANGERRPLKSSLPLLLAHEPKKIKLLGDYAPKERCKRSDRTTEISPFIKEAHAYRLLPEYRFELPHDPNAGRLKLEDGSLTIYRGRSKSPEIIVSRLHEGLWRASELPRGPLETPIPLDESEQHLLVAANRAFVFLNSPGACWRIPLKDMAKLDTT